MEKALNLIGVVACVLGSVYLLTKFLHWLIRRWVRYEDLYRKLTDLEFRVFDLEHTDHYPTRPVKKKSKRKNS